MTYNELLILGLLIHLAIGVWCYRVAARKERDGVLWFILGAMFSVFALAAVYLVADQKSRGGRGKTQTAHRWLWRGLAMLPALVGLIIDFSLRGFPTKAATGLALFAGVLAVYLLGLALINLILSAPWAPLSVARTLIDEAMAYRVLVGVVGVIFLGVVACPLLLNPEQPLSYRVQMNLSFSLLWVSLWLVILTIVLSCWTLSSEVDKSHVFITLTKPIGRGAFLMGKWLGIVMLNALLLAVSGSVIFASTKLYLAQQQRTIYDEIVINEQVLTARVPIEPVPPDGLDRAVEQRYEARLREKGEDFIAGRGGPEKFKEEIRQQLLGGWMSLGPPPPIGGASFRQEYVFDGLSAVGNASRTLQVQYKIRGTIQSDVARLNWYVFDADSNRYILISEKPRAVGIEAPLDTNLTLLVPIEGIDKNGRLELRVENVTPGNSTVKFVGDDGLLLYYKVGSFGGNFVRALMVTWIKLAFAAAVGLAFSAFLGFPVAVLCTALVYIVADNSGYVISAAYWYPREGAGRHPVKQFISWIGYGFTWLFRLFGDMQQNKRLVDGQYISWREMGTLVFFVGVFYTGFAALLGWLVFNRRELARVQV